MLSRRDVLRLIPAASLACLGVSRSAQPAETSQAVENAPSGDAPLLSGPPVVQQLAVDRFVVSFAVGQMATGWIEWGLSPEELDQRAVASRAGLVAASDRALMVPVNLGGHGAPARRIFYRVVAQTLRYETAYKLHRGELVVGATQSVTLPDAAAAQACVAVVNDTHENVPTVEALTSRIATIEPNVVVWNGDTCASAFDAPAELARVLLKPAWATSRALMFVPGNHDVRGACARDVGVCIAAGPDASLPYNVAHRHGPLALLTLDTGEDKPDAHPVFAGTADYESYRVRQAAWLREALHRPDIATAPFKVVFCHIPLRGLPSQNDGLGLDGFAAWSGDGARSWMPVLREERVAAVVSGHTHAWRVDDPAEGQPMQVVGGGPNLNQATLIVLRADAQSLRVTIEDPTGKPLIERQLRTIS